MPQIKKTKPKTKKASAALVAKPKPKKTKTTREYYECMCHQTKKGIKPKRITEVTHECKTNALAINTKMSQARAKAAKKIKDGYETLGKGLSEFISTK
jgi:hypothetical protein